MKRFITLLAVTIIAGLGIGFVAGFAYQRSREPVTPPKPPAVCVAFSAPCDLDEPIDVRLRLSCASDEALSIHGVQISCRSSGMPEGMRPLGPTTEDTAQ